MVDQDAMKTSNTREENAKDVRRDQESRFVKVKRMLTDSLTKKSQTQTPSNYEEAKIICKARKRKERQESTGSVSQERKVIRSNSEERPTVVTNETSNKDIRRVVSHEDFQKAHPLHEHNETIIVSLVEMNINTKYSPPKSINVEVLGYDDCERRRYHERFAPALAQRGRRINPGRKYKNKHFSKSRVHKDEQSSKENDICTNNNDIKSKFQEIDNNQEIKINTVAADDAKIFKSDSNNEFIQLVHQEDKEPSPSPAHTPISSTLDLSTLHQQIDSSEPMPSSSSQEITDDAETLPSLLVASSRLLSSPRNSIMVTHRIYLDPNVQQTKTSLSKESKSPLDKKLKQLSKQISTLKRKLKKYDDEFQLAYGYKPSQADKLNDKNIRKFCIDLSKLKKEYKQLKGDNTATAGFTSEDNIHDDFKEQNIQNTLTEIEKKLNEKRISSDRGIAMEDMSSEQIIGEKVAVQKALLYLESVHGRPSGKEDRDLVRPLYDRYRTLKRMMAKISLNSTAANELATIHEYETMDFVSSPPQASENETEKQNPSASTDSDTDISLGESLHTLTLDELLQQQREMNEEKKKLRRSLKEFENEFVAKTGRKMQKDDKLLMANVYTSYKQTKAKLRLLDALVAKQIS